MQHASETTFCLESRTQAPGRKRSALRGVEGFQEFGAINLTHAGRRASVQLLWARLHRLSVLHNARTVLITCMCGFERHFLSLCMARVIACTTEQVLGWNFQWFSDGHPDLHNRC